jgi:hypothetical protein
MATCSPLEAPFVGCVVPLPSGGHHPDVRLANADQQGIAILVRSLSRYGLWAAFVISLVYVVIGTALVPRLWSDPLGPMLKIWPVLVLNLVAMAIREDR